jgi:serine phosphatase RsbU (regulator of sigma subunit)
LPRHRPKSADYASWEHYEPAQEVGGDYYDYIPLDPPDQGDRASWTRWAVALGDVVGKGMPAALLMSSLSSEVRHRVRIEPDPAEVVARLNRHFHDAEIVETFIFITLLLVIVDARDHRITVVNAGHPAPLIRRASGQVEILGEDESGPPLGVVRDHPFQPTSARLGPGDVVVLYTDGVTDSIDARHRAFGIEAVKRVVAAAPGEATEVGEALLKALRIHVAGRPQVDDVALVAFGRGG